MGDTGIKFLTTSGDWQYAKKITFNSAAISENLANVPVLINLANAGADFWSHVSSNNNDLRFLDTDCTTELYYEVESWDHASHQGLIWVKVPQIAASSATDFIYMEYGNPYPPASMYQDSAKVWGSDYKLVQHLKETTGTHQDSSAFNNDGSPLNGVLQGITGKIDGADDLDGTNDYISFGASSSLTLTSFTIEAWVRRDGNGVTTTTSGGTGGFTAEPIITKGNSYNDNPGVNINYFLGIQQTDNRIGLDFEDVEKSGLNHAVIGSTPLVNGQWYYVVATYDGTTKIYLNGNLDVSTYLGVTPDSNQWAATAGTAIAGDGAGTPEGYFNGAIDEVRISQGARSAEWIEAQYLSTSNAYASFGTETTPPVPPNKPTNPSPTNGATGVSTSTSCSVTVSHPNSQAMDVSFYQAGTEAAPDFTLVVMPDTQNYATSYPNIFNQQTQWIVDNAASMNTLFVTQEGDVVNTDGSTTEWQNANTAMTILDNGNIPFGVAPGNHDLAGTGNFLTYFPYSRFSGETWYGGAYNNINSNSYQLFKGGDDNYLIFHITYDASDAVLAWADSVIDAHPNTRVIITTHHFLETNGNRDTEITLASRMWNNLITPHADQVFLVLCGHHHGEARRVDIVNGHPIYQILADYQSLSNGGNGYLRILNFHPSEDKIFVQTYSTYLNQYDTDSVSQFTLDYDMSGQEFSAPVLIGTANDVPSGGTATVQWNGLASSTEYYWFAIAEDAQGAIRQSDTWSFTTGEPPQPNYSEMGYSTTMPGASSNFSIRWTDPDGLTNCVFSTDNSGSWVDTPVAISGTNSLASIIITLPSTPGTTVHYRWTCEDTLGNKGDTGTQSLVTSSNAQYVKKITFNNGAIGENLVNVPVLVNLNRAGTDFWSHVNSNVNDLRFMDSDFTTELYYEVEYWNYASHQGSVWVKVPQINAGSATDFIYLFYGNSNPPTNPYNSPTNVWDSNYALVMHLGEASGTRYDSTGNNNDASTGGTPTATTGLVDGACDFDGTSDYLEAADSSSLDFGDVVTLEMWLNPHDVDTNIGGIDKGTGTIYLMGNNTAGHYGKIRLGLSATGTIVASKTAIPENTWSYVVGTKNGADARIYINGALDNQITTTAYTGTNNPNNLRIGQRSGYASEGLNSILDEVRISKIARSAGWIQSQYLSISDQYVTFGSEQAPPSPPNKPTAPNPADDATGVSTSPTCSVTVTDPDGDPMDVSFYQVTQRQQTAQDFSIVVLPDTQIYSASYPNIFTSQTQWIVSNKAAMNILFVTHEGDVIDSYSTNSQWTNAVNSMSILDGNVPYGIAPGNHDLNQGSTTTNFNTYFGTSKFAGESWYGDSYNGDNANSYEFFSNGADQYLIIHLMNNPSTAVLTWAGSVVDAYPNHRVIVTTHEYLSGGARSTVGNNIWSNFIQSRTDQIFLVLCGHNLGESSATDTSTGHTVYQLMADYQGYTNGGNGYLRLLNFKPAQDQIYIQTYSP
jgi:hypothetical protein